MGGLRGSTVAALFIALLLGLATSASAHNLDELSEYGTANVNGVIGAGGAEYENSCTSGTETVGGTSYGIQVCEQNDEQNDYYAVKIGDLTQDTGNIGDSVLLWFDNNHDGLVQTSGSGCPYNQPNEDKIGWYFETFWDGYYCVDGSSLTFGFDLTVNGTGQRTFTPGQGWTFEFSHPLDTVDPDDYSLAIHDTVGWCMVYDDKSNSPPNNPGTAVGEIQFPPGCFVNFANSTGGLARGDATLLADVRKLNAFDELLESLRKKLSKLVAGCKPCPPDPRKELLAKINEVIKFAKKERKAKTLRGLKRLKGPAKELGGKVERKALKQIRAQIKLIKKSKKSAAQPNTPTPGGVHAGQTVVRQTGVR